MNYQSRRNQLMNQMKDNSCMILFSGVAPKRSADEQYPFVVNRNFYYLTGIKEPNLVLVLNKKDTSELLFIEESDELYEKWVGKKISKTEAETVSGIKEIQYTDTFYKWLKGQVITEWYLDLEEDQFNQAETLAEEMEQALEGNVMDCYPMITKLRSVKSEEEVNEIKEAIKITQEGIENIVKELAPNKRESQFEAAFDYILKSYNVNHAFPTIAASGKNACTLHYVTNNEFAQNNDLVLFDLGATHNLYCADISRTFPVSGKFTERQKEIYQIVLDAQTEMIAAVKPGITMKELNQVIVDFYGERLKEIGLIQTKEEVSKYYYHGVSHSLGLDTHDVGLSREEPLVAGNVITAEPGLYIAEEGIGIRIEDDILVTEDGHINLSSGILKTVAEIEKAMKR